MVEKKPNIWIDAALIVQAIPECYSIIITQTLAKLRDQLMVNLKKLKLSCENIPSPFECRLGYFISWLKHKSLTVETFHSGMLNISGHRVCAIF